MYIFIERWVFIWTAFGCIMLRRALSHRRALFAEMLLARASGDSLSATFQLPAHRDFLAHMQSERWYWPHSFITLRLSLLFSPHASAAENAVCKWKWEKNIIWWMERQSTPANCLEGMHQIFYIEFLSR